MHYLLLYDYVENAVERRAPFRAEHLRLAQEARGRGELLMGGAFAEPVDGAALLFQAHDPSVVEAFVRADPYVTNGVVTRWRIRPWTVVVGAGARSFLMDLPRATAPPRAGSPRECLQGDRPPWDKLSRRPPLKP